MGDQDSISVTVLISPTVPPSTTIDIWDGIFDHAGTLADWVTITFHVTQQQQLTVEWDKYVDGVAWTPGMEITRQTSDTIGVVEVIHIVPSPPAKIGGKTASRPEETIAQGPVFAQIETWDPTRLHLLNWAATGGEVIVDPAGQAAWTAELIEPDDDHPDQVVPRRAVHLDRDYAVGGAVARPG